MTGTRERTLQNHLQEIFHTELKSTRPKGRKECRDRMIQMERYKGTAALRGPEHDSLRAKTLMPMKAHSKASHTSHIGFPRTSRSIEDPSARDVPCEKAGIASAFHSMSVAVSQNVTATSQLITSLPSTHSDF